VGHEDTESVVVHLELAGRRPRATKVRSYENAELPTSSAKALLAIAKVSAPVATAAAELLASGEVDVAKFEESPATALERVARLEDGPPLVAAGGYHAVYTLEELPLPEEAAAELATRLDAIPRDPFYGPIGFRFDQDDVRRRARLRLPDRAQGGALRLALLRDRTRVPARSRAPERRVARGGGQGARGAPGRAPGAAGRRARGGR